MTQYVIIAKRNIWRGRKNHARSRIKENISRKEKGTFMSKVRRVYVEKKPAFAVKAKELQAEIKSYLGISSVTGVRELIRYDIENISEETYKKALVTVFSEPPVDTVFEETFELGNAKTFSVEYLPGQFDQRADSAEQCVKLLNEEEEPVIRTATTYVIEGEVTEEQLEAIKHHCINPVDSRETGLEKPETLVQNFEDPADVISFVGFADMPEAQLKELYSSLNLAMTFKDFLHIQNYFKNTEKRNPSVTEIRVLDTYWSDHCRHTTFSTELKNVKFDEGFYQAPIKKTYEEYLDTHKKLYAGRDDKFVCLMDLALLAMKRLKKEGKLADQEESDEINACSIVVPVEVDGKTEEWLVNFKNETHNHPTEIEPFGGAATCLGGAIRDPLSGRTYVYQAMRVTGAADPTVSVKDTIEGKLPQKKIVREAARGYSSYGNQIGLATGYVKEVYHPDYVAKRMEIGAVMGAAPRRAVQRLTSDPGDRIILLGGRTGRDGIGGATGSSKAHNTQSIINRINHYIEDHIEDYNLSLTELARMTGFNPSYLSRLYRMHTGRKLSEQIDAAKLRHAQELILSGTMVKNVAERTGFASPSAFILFFKRNTGKTPRQFFEERTTTPMSAASKEAEEEQK